MNSLREWRAGISTIDALAFAPDGRTLASGGQHDDVVHIWEVCTGGERYRHIGHQGQLDCAAYSPNGKLLATGSMDTTVLIWNAKKRSQINPPTKPWTKKKLQSIWSDLASENAQTGYRAIQALLNNPAQAMPLLQKHLQPIPTPSEKHVLLHIKNLDSENFQIRTKANRELEQCGEAIEEALRTALLKKQKLETDQRIRRLLMKITSNRARRMYILRGG